MMVNPWQIVLLADIKSVLHCSRWSTIGCVACHKWAEEKSPQSWSVTSCDCALVCRPILSCLDHRIICHQFPSRYSKGGIKFVLFVLFILFESWWQVLDSLHRQDLHLISIANLQKLSESKAPHPWTPHDRPGYYRLFCVTLELSMWSSHQVTASTIQVSRCGGQVRSGVTVL